MNAVLILLPADPTPGAVPLGLLLIILQKARSKAMARCLLSPAQPANQGCVEDANVDFCSQWDVGTPIKYFSCNLRTPYRVLSLRQEALLILFSRGCYCHSVHCFGLVSVPHPNFGIFRSWLIFLLFHLKRWVSLSLCILTGISHFSVNS